VVALPVIMHKSLTSSSALNLFYRLFEWTEQAKIVWRQVRNIGGVWQYLTLHFLHCFCCHSGGVRTRVVVEETDAFE
jgi:hypothetical protein